MGRFFAYAQNDRLVERRALRMTTGSRDKSQNDNWVERRARKENQEGGTNKEEPNKEKHPPVSRGKMRVAGGKILRLRSE